MNSCELPDVCAGNRTWVISKVRLSTIHLSTLFLLISLSTASAVHKYMGVGLSTGLWVTYNWPYTPKGQSLSLLQQPPTAKSFPFPPANLEL